MSCLFDIVVDGCRKFSKELPATFNGVYCVCVLYHNNFTINDHWRLSIYERIFMSINSRLFIRCVGISLTSQTLQDRTQFNHICVYNIDVICVDLSISSHAMVFYRSMCVCVCVC